MNKDTFYFSHDSNAHKDIKMIRLRRLGGLEAYGLFWCLIEMLREATDNKLPLAALPEIAYELRTHENLFDQIFTCGLLEKDAVSFWSNSLIRRMQKYHKMVEQKKLAGRKSGESRRVLNESSTDDQRMLNGCSTDVQHVLNENEQTKLKETKLNQSKEKRTTKKTSHSDKPNDEGKIVGEKKDPNFYGIWLDVNKDLGRNPGKLPQDPKQTKQIFEALDKDAAKLKHVFYAYLQDTDPFLLKLGHPLSQLLKTLPKYLNSTMEYEEYEPTPEQWAEVEKIEQKIKREREERENAEKF